MAKKYLRASGPQKERRQNHLLAALPSGVRKRLSSEMEVIHFEAGDVLFNPGDTVEFVYFPHRNTMFSLLCSTEATFVEIGVTGSEGFVGVPGILGSDVSPHQVIAQIPGSATKLRVRALQSEFQRDARVQKILLKYVSSLLAQVSQTALCNRIHTIEERLARWLLISQDRVRAKEMPLKHEFLAKMLAVNRANLTLAALKLKESGLIHYTRARVAVVDRKRLEQVSCSCYRIVRGHFRNVLESSRGTRRG
jgi:CRP-like cAMP-binding protein